MGQVTKIEWTDHTFNPWIGCAKVHRGCKHCYAEADMDKRRRRVTWGLHGTRSRTSDAYWRQPVRWNAAAAVWDLHCELCRQSGVDDFVGEWKRRDDGNPPPPRLLRRSRVFCASLADVFEDWDWTIQNVHKSPLQTDGKGNYSSAYPYGWKGARMDDLRADLFRLIDHTPYLDWLLLTKRPENIARMWRERKDVEYTPEAGRLNDYPLNHRDNVWLGTSISDQTTAEAMIPELLKCRDLAHRLFLSIEPMTGPIDLSRFIGDVPVNMQGTFRNVARGSVEWENAQWWNRGVDWIIVGGESGKDAEPMHPDWVRSIRDQCQAVGVPFFFKQWGEWGAVHHPIGGAADQAINGQIDCRYGEWHEDGRFVESCLCGGGSGTVARVGKKAAGRLLDGREWSEFPESGASWTNGSGSTSVIWSAGEKRPALSDSPLGD